ncbi:flagellar export protein FliJ [Gottfriedia luciferensis]|uniref:flagellar export protein FliJ n=1 Tax=Gottfriedia luciferensis TaxID=178774 RepID=UPI000B4340A9|nr:flagellar export protein FliJ [Gottfriedia luciferensis]
MAIPFRFEKILTIKQKEKEQVQINYEAAVKSFEKEATKLYELLRKKEMLDEHTELELNNGFSIIGIKQHQLFRDSLEKDISKAQYEVMRTRNIMSQKQEELLDQNVEVKKFEKMKEKAFKLHHKNLVKMDSKLMDDLSLQQFVNRNL